MKFSLFAKCLKQNGMRRHISFHFVISSAGVIFAVKQALSILSRSVSYLNEPESFSALPFDLLSMAYYESGDLKNALAAAENALALAPNDERIRKNAEFFRKNV